MIGQSTGLYGLAMHRDGAVQVEPLTWMMVADCDWTNGNHKRWFYRFVFALDRALKDLKEYYTEPPSNPSESYDYVLPNPPHDAEDPATKKKKNSVECWFPYPQSYTSLTGGGTIDFTYSGRIFQQRLLFTATETKSQRRILIKFARRYEMAAHELLAKNQLAPALYGCEDVMKGLGWVIVAMEYLPDWVPLASKSHVQMQKYRHKIKDALEHLWGEGWVHGDVRHHNILVPSSDE
jgi:hypothetical protein